MKNKDVSIGRTNISFEPNYLRIAAGIGVAGVVSVVAWLAVSAIPMRATATSLDTTQEHLSSASVELPAGRSTGAAALRVDPPPSAETPSTATADGAEASEGTNGAGGFADDTEYTATIDDLLRPQTGQLVDARSTDDDVARWRRAIHLENRFQGIMTLLDLEAIDVVASLEVDGMSPPYRSYEEYLVDLHNNSELVTVVSEDGSERSLSSWFAEIDAFSAAIVERTIELSSES